jgi:phage terminase large subunit-like protein
VPFDKTAADRAVYFIRCLTHTKGKWAGQRFDLMPWQEDLIRKLFGTVREDGRRQYRKAFVAIPKKNGKSDLAAAVGNKLLFADDESAPEVYSAAADRSQASMVFDVAAQMIRNAPELDSRCKILDSTKRVLLNDGGGLYRALSADVKTKHGQNTSGLLFDELHAQPHRRLWDVLTVGSGAARAQQLIFAITTAGSDLNSICYDEWDYARRVSRGEIEDPTLLPVIYELPEDADWEDSANWEKVNPSLGRIFGMEQIREEYRQAKKSPADENNFRRLRLNQWTKQEIRWLPMSAWRAARQQIDWAALEGQPCYAGLDLASTRDVNAFVLTIPRGEDYLLRAWFWLPRAAAEAQEERYGTPWSKWEREGRVTITEGQVSDQQRIMDDILAIARAYEIREVAYDEWGAIKLIQDLASAGAPFVMVPMRQTFKSMSGPAKELERLLLTGHLVHDGDQVLDFMADCVTVLQDGLQNIRPVKPARDAKAKVDGIVAAIMALGRAIRNAGSNVRSAYEDADGNYQGLVTV